MHPSSSASSKFSGGAWRRRPLASLLLLCGALAGSTCACAGAQAQPAAPSKPATPAAKPPRDPAKALAQGKDLLLKSEYGEAEANLRAALVGKQKAEAETRLAELLVLTGRYDDAVAAAKSAAKSKQFKAEATTLAAKALRAEGKLDEALSWLEKVEKDPDARAARLLQGEILLEKGKRSEAEASLMTLIEDYNSDKINDTDAAGLAMVGRAAHLLRSPQDANDAFNEAERAKPGDIQTLLWRAELFLEKYDPGHAEEVVKEVLTQAPNHPEALVWMAHVKLAQALDFDAATRLVKQALKINPKLGNAHFVLAGINLRDMELADADQHLDDGLKYNPRDLDLLSLKAAVRFLADDNVGFKQAKQKVLKLNPQYSRMFQIIGDYAEWEHRYDEIVEMMREALKIDSEDAKAEAQLGLNLIRAGNDKEGLQALNSAFDKDKFNVRVFNTLNLYEETIAKQYVSVQEGQFTFRYYKKEKAILERYIPGLMRDAWKAMVKYYGFTPSQPIGVELYAERQDFAIRTSGLPGTAIQGVCFGKTLASMSPYNETFNVGMTVWHELAHVFHIQMSKSHVPRWFTEGMAEYETIVARPEWQREQDQDLFAALRDDRLPKLGNMNKAFTRAEELSDIATAYYASSQILVMLGEKYGRAKLNKMLELWAEGKRTPEVLKLALGKDSTELDQEFAAFSGKLLGRYKTQFMPIRRTGPFEDAEDAAKKAPSDARAQTVYALALLRQGKAKQADSALQAALKADPKFPDAIFLQAQLALAKRDAAEGKRLLKQLITNGNDGYAVRMMLADIAEGTGDAAGMKSELEAASKLDPSMAEPVQALVDLATKTKDEAAELDGLRKLAKLEQHDPRVYRRLMEKLLEKKELAEARAAGEAGTWADLEGMDTHRVFGEVLLASKMVPRAIFEGQSALLCKGRPKDQAKVHDLLARAYAAVPNAKEAAKHRKLAKEVLKKAK
ncbi:MAG: tetratricopeptide repeat protein [Polyangiaceae bacterium]